MEENWFEESCCEAYNNLGEPQMEGILYHSEFSPINEDAAGDHVIDDRIYYEVLGCGGLMP